MTGDEIGSLTMLQFHNYMTQIPEIFKLFNTGESEQKQAPPPPSSDAEIAADARKFRVTPPKVR